MTAPERSSGVRIDWARVVERLCFLFPPVVGVGAIGVVRELDPGVPGLQTGLVLFGTFGYTLLTIGMMVALFLDTRWVRSSSQWQPSTVLNTTFAFFWAPAAGVVYLARRHRRFETPAGWSGWWVVIAASLAATLLGIAAVIVGFVLEIPGLIVAAVGFAGTIAVGTFPVAIHQDAAYVCTRAPDWRPNPGTYLGLAVLSLFVVFLQPVLAGYYLARRRRALGVP